MLENDTVGSADGEKQENTGVELVENKAQNHEQRPSPNQICKDTTSRNTSSTEISTVTDDSIEEEEKEEDACKRNNSRDQEQIDNKVEHSSFYTIFLGKSKKNQDKRKDNTSSIEKMGSPISFPSPSSSQSTFTKSKSYSTGASKVLLNLITCGAVDTNDAALVLQSQKNKNKYKPIDTTAGHICKGEELGGSARVFGAPWNQVQQQRQHKTANARYIYQKNYFKISSSTLSKLASVMNVRTNGPLILRIRIGCTVLY